MCEIIIITIVCLIVAYLYLRVPMRTRGLPYDINAWDAMEFIRKKTIFGYGRSREYIVNYMRLAAAVGRITVWAMPEGVNVRMEVHNKLFAEYTFQMEPEGCGGKVVHEVKGVLSAPYYSRPKLSVKQLRFVFKKRFPGTRFIPWVRNWQDRRAERIATRLRIGLL